MLLSLSLDFVIAVCYDERHAGFSILLNLCTTFPPLQASGAAASHPAPTAPPLQLNSLQFVLGPELRAQFPVVLSMALSGQVRGGRTSLKPNPLKYAQGSPFFLSFWGMKHDGWKKGGVWHAVISLLRCNFLSWVCRGAFCVWIRDQWDILWERRRLCDDLLKQKNSRCMSQKLIVRTLSAQVCLYKGSIALFLVPCGGGRKAWSVGLLLAASRTTLGHEHDRSLDCGGCGAREVCGN